MPNKQDCATIVYTPNDASRLALQELENRRNAPNAGMQLGIPIVDKSLLPLRPGQLVVILGRPSNYKSGLMQYLARREALRLAAGNAANEVVVYATWEMAIEELAIYDLAATTAIDSEALAHGTVSAEDWGKLQQAAIQRAVTPTWLIGHSIERRKKRPRLSMDNVAQALLWLDDHMGMKPAVVFLDYLQRMASDRAETDRRLQVAENMERCKDMALSLACPVFVGVQAGRQVDDRDWKLPIMGDGQETSNIEQTADVALSVWMPKVTQRAGTRVPHTDLEVSPNLLILGLQKQRLGPAGLWWPLYVDPTRNLIAEMQTGEPF